ncbi:MAG: carbohydrate ABC transporter permease [Candidatus Eremiobacteraeota bacterium]|nr:carbohydrate ABC transporter permease [Candidatus Eremiobacteraeota bacterium]MCW5870584.1 carbohydrate ABC transporter permease [Candidatus Eremiobacteraeota bacterium]
MLVAGSLQAGGLGNYLAVGQRVDFLRLLFNSLWISGWTVVLGALVNSLAGYALARLQFPGRAVLLGLVLICMVIPFEAVAAPLFYSVSRLGLRDTLGVQILPFVANGVSIYLFYTFYLEFPRELEEAACLEGAGPWQIYGRLVLPNSGPVLATHSVITLLSSWGAYLWPLLVTAGPQARPLPLALANFMTTPPLHWGQIFAFGVLMVVPVLLGFGFLQRYFQPGSLTSGIK